MPVTVLCQGCGGRVPVPDDYDRARIRCTQCGVLCELPADRPKKAPPPAAPSRKSKPEEPEAVADFLLLPESIQAEPDRRAKKPSRSAATTAPKLPDVAYPTEHSKDDDGKPYYVEGLDKERPCPNCGKKLHTDDTFCTGCGFNLLTRKKAVQSFEPVDREWQGGWLTAVRVAVFVGIQAVLLPLMILGAYTKGYLFGWIFPWFFLTAMTAFLLGTYDRIHLKRNKKGQVLLTKTWSVCFLPRPPHQVDVIEFGGVVSGKKNEVGFIEVFLLVLLLIHGIIPGLIWYYLAFYRDIIYVALSKDHGYAAFILYQGGDPDMARDIATTVRDTAKLPYDRV